MSAADFAGKTVVLLDMNKITSRTCAMLDPESTRRVKLDYTEVDDACAIHVASFAQLTDVSVVKTRITVDGVRALLLARAVEFLSVGRTDLSELSADLSGSPVTKLAIQGTPVTPSLMKSLSSSPSLDDLLLYNCEIRPGALSGWQPARPISRLTLFLLQGPVAELASVLEAGSAEVIVLEGLNLSTLEASTLKIGPAVRQLILRDCTISPSQLDALRSNNPGSRIVVERERPGGIRDAPSYPPP